MIHKETGQVCNLLELAYKHRNSVAADVGTLVSEASDGELAALISYAIAFPQRFVALVDTYDVKRYDILLILSISILFHILLVRSEFLDTCVYISLFACTHSNFSMLANQLIEYYSL